MFPLCPVCKINVLSRIESLGLDLHLLLQCGILQLQQRVLSMGLEAFLPLLMEVLEVGKKSKIL